MAVTVMLVVSAGVVVHHLLLGQVTRLDGAFAGLDQRPAEVAPGALNILVLGVRRPDTGVTSTAGSVPSLPWLPGAALESAMVVHLAADRRSAAVAAMPLTPHLEAELTESQPSTAVATLEGLTEVWIDHLAVVDWSTLESLGADNGATPLEADTAGELRERARRQLVFLREVAENTLHTEMRKQPWRVYEALDTVTQGMALDREWSSLELALAGASLWALRSGEIDFFVADPAEHDAWTALREDRVRTWASEHRERIEETAS